MAAALTHKPLGKPCHAHNTTVTPLRHLSYSTGTQGTTRLAHTLLGSSGRSKEGNADLSFGHPAAVRQAHHGAGTKKTWQQ